MCESDEEVYQESFKESQARRRKKRKRDNRNRLRRTKLKARNCRGWR